MPNDADGRRIVKLLDTLTAYGQRQDRIFEDWLDYCEASLRMMPRHALSIVQTGKTATDSETDVALFSRLRNRYGERGKWTDVFARALTVMTDVAATGEIKDLVGDIYMAYGWPNNHTGQFFTPMPAAHMMAQLTFAVQDVIGEVKQRVLAAAEKTALGQALMLAGWLYPQQETFSYFLRVVLPELLPHIEPITVSDPCCGSGVMFLAVARILPRWITQFGIVAFYGQDIDATCVTMAKINTMLYGLNGWGARWMAAQWLLEAKYAEKTSLTTSQSAHQPAAQPTLQELPASVPTAAHIQLAQENALTVPQPDFQFDRGAGAVIQLTMFGETAVKPKCRSNIHAMHA